MKILILSFYYTPDLSAGSFRTAALVDELRKHLKTDDSIEVVTTMPNRYHRFKLEAHKTEQQQNISIKRIKLNEHKSGFFDQSVSFFYYSVNVLRYVRKREYDLIYATSSRLFTGVLAAIIARSKAVPLYLDIRDIFVDTMNSLLKKPIKYIVLPVFKLIERLTLRTASKINIVSKGFHEYISKRVPGTSLSCYTNGIDDEFIDEFYTSTEALTPPEKSAKKIITYAGNIGQGQGLESIIPAIAVRLGEDYEFRVIGDGGARASLEKELVKSGVKNVSLVAPVNRENLIRYYKNSDYLFMHLNKVPAFEKVLPSKVFEFAVTGKPILAGVNGYPRTFLQENISGVMLFNPCDPDDFLKKFTTFNPDKIEIDRGVFCKEYTRSRIMRCMVNDVLSIVK